MDEIELYNLKEDISETRNVASEYPEVVKKIEALADAMRKRLGDKLYQMEGSETREIGIVSIE